MSCDSGQGPRPTPPGRWSAALRAASRREHQRDACLGSSTRPSEPSAATRSDRCSRLQPACDTAIARRGSRSPSTAVQRGSSTILPRDRSSVEPRQAQRQEALVGEDLRQEQLGACRAGVARRCAPACRLRRCGPDRRRAPGRRRRVAKPISCVTTSMVMPAAASSFITSSTSLIISGSSAEVGSSKSMIFGLHRQRAGDGHALLLPARELARDTCRACSGMPTRFSSSMAIVFGLLASTSCAP